MFSHSSLFAIGSHPLQDTLTQRQPSRTLKNEGPIIIKSTLCCAICSDRRHSLLLKLMVFNNIGFSAAVSVTQFGQVEVHRWQHYRSTPSIKNAIGNLKTCAASQRKAMRIAQNTILPLNFNIERLRELIV
jgi:hypothetical protein